MNEILLSDIKIGERFRKDLGDIEGLAKSIEELGLLHPIVIDEEKNLIAGYRRIKAFEKLNRKTIPFTKISIEEIRKGEIKENIDRKDFAPSEIEAIRKYVEKNRIGHRPEKGGKLPPLPKGKTRNVVSKIVGKSPRTIDKIAKIVEAAKENPKKFGNLLKKVDQGKISINYAHDHIKRAHQHSDPPLLPKGEFDVIYADPPWHYDVKSRGAENHYPVVDELELTKLEIPIAKDSVLFLWATNAKLREALNIMSSWGFEYKTNVVWVKNKIATGFYVRGKHELLLIGRRGEIPLPMENTRPESVILADTQEHSKKPEIVYELIESMYPNRKYLELFARQTRKGWTSWGDEI